MPFTNLLRLRKLKKSFSAGATILTQGEDTTEIFILTEGVVGVFVNNEHIADLNVDRGDLFFGEMASILGQPRSATVKAKTRCSVICIPSSSLLDVLHNSRSLLGKLLSQFSYRTKELHSQITHENGSNKFTETTAEEKLAEIICYMDGLMGLLEAINEKCDIPEISGLCNYLHKTNPCKLKRGALSSLDKDVVEECGLEHLLDKQVGKE
ncbi:cyclic nucleotide-binding domain-containing protein [Planctomycetota bacterium]